ncbi:MAG: hypothetical protein IJ328_07185, partial [Muribaculaceae bacterium]|nr:hypothetical protein [Muribaculaceae bacterium]
MKYVDYILRLVAITTATAIQMICGTETLAQTLSNNYILQRVMRDSSATTCNEIIRYYDGLGKQKSLIQRKITPEQKDLATYIVYDNAGRESCVYQPFVSNKNGEFLTQEESYSLAVSSYSDTAPYTITEYEKSDLNRPIKIIGPGEDWHNNSKALRTEYLTNIEGNDSLDCILYNVTDTRDLSDTLFYINKSGSYPTGKLYVTRIEDEDGNIVFSFKDMQDKTLLTRKVLKDGASHTYADTYYIFDNYERLTATLSPEASLRMKEGISWSSSSLILREFATLYMYDRFGRCRAKRISGGDWAFYVHDMGDRLIFSQDGNMREQGLWHFTLYDDFDRECITGLCENSFDVAGNNIPDFLLRISRNNSTDTFKGYQVDTTSVVIYSPSILTVNYYDDYAFMGSNDIPNDDNFSYESMADYGKRYSNSAKTFLTGSLSAVISTTETSFSQYLITVNYYDEQGRIIQQKSSDQYNGCHKTYNAYDFRGNLIKSRVKYERLIGGESEDITDYFYNTVSDEIYSYTYDNADRPVSVTLIHNGGEEKTLARYVYNELGRLVSTEMLNNAVNIEYDYNIRGWTTWISDNLSFLQQIRYNKPEGDAIPCYNGNISEMSWSVGIEKKSLGSIMRTYSYGYDSMNRLKSATYKDTHSTTRKFGEFYHYDMNCNIAALQREGMTTCVYATPEITEHGLIDDLTFTRIGNRLTKVYDNAEELSYYGALDVTDGMDNDIEYTWDANGNMTSDRNRDISSVEYNVLNLPGKVRYNLLHQAHHTYDARGRKLGTRYILAKLNAITPEIPLNPGIELTPRPLSSQLVVEMSRDYLGYHICENDTLVYTETPVGFIKNDTIYAYVKDYRGNVRSVIDEFGNVAETNL